MRGIIAIIIIWMLSCEDKRPNYFELGKKSFEEENYALAESQFRSVRKDNENYKEAEKYLRSIDSIEISLYRINSVRQQKRDSTQALLRKKYVGDYKVEVKGVSSEKEVEVYRLNINGQSEWMWVEYSSKGNSFVEAKKLGTWKPLKDGVQIDIRGNSGLITETYRFKNGILQCELLPKRYLVETSEEFF